MWAIWSLLFCVGSIRFFKDLYNSLSHLRLLRNVYDGSWRSNDRLVRASHDHGFLTCENTA